MREEAASEPDEEPLTRPVRWGDRVKPADVLVHPRPSPESTDKDADTQPHPVFDDDAPRPAPRPRAGRRAGAARQGDA
ncbi:hypothetical protein [Nonomuraea salmonea]|uniref:hypothetical protein n=1 Tax=Nonomuraea salmonea TaxID=46181 RepID=UPI002FEBE152